MLSDLMQYLWDNYSFTVTELSQTGGHNRNCESKGGHKFIESDFKMIDMDFISCKFPGISLSTADGLYFKEKDGFFHFYLVEFKKMKFDDLNSVDISLYHLKNAREVCGRNSNCFFDAYDKCEKYLADKDQVSLEIKPNDTIRLIHKLYAQYRAWQKEGTGDYNFWQIYTHDYSEDSATLEEFSKVKYHYIVVYEFDSFSENMSNTHEETREYFYFLEKLKPYPFDTAISVNDSDFVNEVLREIGS